MAASALQKLLRKPSPPFRFITAFHPSQLTNPILDLPIERHQNLLSPTAPPAHLVAGSIPIFPTFPFGYSPKPLFASGFQSPEDSALEDSGTLWADSVKKKRKRKMNKHKYQKLRKRIRRQT